ncbi:DUF4355 domain-containing protein [Lysinibacillus boronitolerans]|uniref:DUF4355 domain-containing protein n=1 Tax=Lysinibacillus boronitolerans TaxID=309788 RepID=UPI00289AFA3F|nr:DUF4355 domain-containing protein [Lysinibacillus boronitolerans]
MFVNDVPKMLLPLNIQYLADDPPTDDSQDSPVSNEGDPVTYTEEDFQKRLQEEVAKATTKHADDLAAARTEAEKLAKMNADEKAKYELEKREQDLAAKEQEIAARELRSETLSMLADKKYNLPAEVIDIVLGENAETTIKNIETFKAVFDAAVQKSVEERLAGKSPSTGTSGAGKGTEEQIREQFANGLKGVY